MGPVCKTVQVESDSRQVLWVPNNPRGAYTQTAYEAVASYATKPMLHTLGRPTYARPDGQVGDF